MIYDATAEEIEMEGPGVFFNRFTVELDRLNDDLATGTGEHNTLDLIECFWHWYAYGAAVWTMPSGIELKLPPQESP